jgi:hypothetical protein
MASNETSRGSAAAYRLQYGGFNLKIAVVVKILAHGADYGGANLEQLTYFRIYD